MEHKVWGRTIVITPEAEDLDATRASSFRREVEALVERTDSDWIVLDLHRVKRMGTAGVGCFLGIQRRRGGLRLCRLRDQVRVLLDITRFSGLVEIFATPEQAVTL